MRCLHRRSSARLVWRCVLGMCVGVGMRTDMCIYMDRPSAHPNCCHWFAPMDEIHVWPASRDTSLTAVSAVSIPHRTMNYTTRRSCRCVYMLALYRLRSRLDARRARCEQWCAVLPPTHRRCRVTLCVAPSCASCARQMPTSLRVAR